MTALTVQTVLYSTKNITWHKMPIIPLKGYTKCNKQSAAYTCK